MFKSRFVKGLRAFALAALVLLAVGGANTANAQSSVQGKTDAPSGNFTQAASLQAVAYRQGQKASASVKIRPSAVDVLVFDSFTNAETLTTTTGSPRTFMGYAFNAAIPVVPSRLQKSLPTSHLPAQQPLPTIHCVLTFNCGMIMQVRLTQYSPMEFREGHFLLMWLDQLRFSQIPTLQLTLHWLPQCL